MDRDKRLDSNLVHFSLEIGWQYFHDKAAGWLIPDFYPLKFLRSIAPLSYTMDASDT